MISGLHLTSTIHHEPPILELSKGNEPTWKRVFRVAKKKIDHFESTVWKYTKEAAKFTKSVLKVTILASSPLEDKLGRVITYLGLLSLVKILFSFKAMADTLDRIIRNSKLKDIEGIILSSVQMIAEPLEGFSSFLSFVETLHKLEYIPWVTGLSLIALPLSVGLLCYDTVKSTYNLIILAVQFQRMPSSVDSDTIEQLKEYLEQQIGVTQREREQAERSVHLHCEKMLFSSAKGDITVPFPLPGAKGGGTSKAGLNTEMLKAVQKEAKKELKERVQLIKDRKYNKVERQTDKKIANIMVNLKSHLDQYPDDVITAEQALDDMKKLAIRKLTLNGLETTFYVAECVMYVFLLAFPAFAWASVILSVSKSFVSVGKTAYKDYAMDRGLKLPEFIKV